MGIEACATAHLAEFGIVAGVGRNGVERLLQMINEGEDERIPPVARACLMALAAQLDLVKRQIREADRRGKMLTRVRALIKQADPDVVEEVKWRKPSNSMLGVPVWEHDGIICTGETCRDNVKQTFAKGAFLEDPSGLFNASLEGNVRRAIDLREGDTIDEKAFKALILAAVALNASRAKK